jgi:hypothetical protein
MDLHKLASYIVGVKYTRPAVSIGRKEMMHGSTRQILWSKRFHHFSRMGKPVHLIVLNGSVDSSRFAPWINHAHL